MFSGLKLVALASLFIGTFADIDRGLTPHFSAWLKANGYGDKQYERTDLEGGAYGGRSSDTDTIKHNPVIFIHGNSDIAVGYYYWQTGWTESLNYFLSKGYTKGELYATTWGPGD